MTVAVQVLKSKISQSLGVGPGPWGGPWVGPGVDHGVGPGVGYQNPNEDLS